MATLYRVRQGDYVSKIANQYGLANFQTIWEHPRNAPINTRRGTPNVLLPGDVLYIPDKQEKTEVRRTSQVHCFQVTRKGITLRLVLRLLDSAPLADTPCILMVENALYRMVTDGDGRIERDIPVTSENARLSFLGITLDLKIGHLDPVEEPSGQQARLNNLGYDAGDPTDPDAAQRLRYAVEEFQCDNGLDVDGVCGPETQARLEHVCGC